MSFQKKGILFPAHADLNFFSSRARSEPVGSPVMRSPGPASRPTQAEPGDNKVSLQSYSDTATTKPRTTAGCTCGLLTGTLGNSPSAEVSRGLLGRGYAGRVGHIQVPLSDQPVLSRPPQVKCVWTVLYLVLKEPAPPAGVCTFYPLHNRCFSQN